MKQRTLSGPFLTRDLGNGAWLLSTAVPSIDVFLQLTAKANGSPFQGRAVTRLELTWRDEGVIVKVAGYQGAGILEASTAIVHEPKDQLYRSLPLAGFDTKARKFWRRVFLLTRLPGGGALLRLIARRKR